MIAIGVALTFAAYTAGLFGYCLIRGYNITLADLFNWNFPSTQGGKGPTTTAKAGK